ncbi:MAG: rhodanese-like domain-containing protein [bacterium]
MPARIDPPIAHQRLQSESGTIYLDVRSSREFAQGHPVGAYNVPLMEHDPATGMMLPNPHFVHQVQALFPTDAAIITGCRSGQRSFQAASLLEQAGYLNVVDMTGGLSGKANEIGMKIEPGWVDHELPLTKESEPGHDFESLLERIAKGG